MLTTLSKYWLNLAKQHWRSIERNLLGNSHKNQYGTQNIPKSVSGTFFKFIQVFTTHMRKTYKEKLKKHEILIGFHFHEIGAKYLRGKIFGTVALFIIFCSILLLYY